MSNRTINTLISSFKLQTSRLVVLCVLLLSALSSFSQVQFDAKVSKKKLGINERLRIDFKMNKDGDNFSAPNFTNFTARGPNTSISNSWVNGKVSYSKTYSYYLTPKRKGKFTIGQATIEIEGQTYKTPVVKVEVTDAVSKPKDGNNADYVASENIHLVAEVSNAKPYLNQGITVVYKLYISPNVQVSNYRELDSPKFADFWSQNIEVKGLKLQQGTYKGENYYYVVCKRAVLYPQKTGKLTLEPLSLDLGVQVPTNRRDFFGRPLMQTVNKTVTAATRTINVKPLPLEGKPVNFTGAVGNFSFHVTTTKDALNATESLQAKVEVRGKGNLKLFNLPKLTVPSALEVYEPERKESVRTNLSGMQGSISDTYTIVPQYKGKYPIPDISFSYFDLKTASYKTLNSNNIVVNVLEGPTNTTAAQTNTTIANKQQVINKNTFAFINTTTKLTSKTATYFFKSNLFWSLMLVPFFAIPLAIFIRRKRYAREADVFGNRIRKADRLAKKYLSEAKKSLHDKTQFYIALERALHNYLKAKLHIETSDFSKEKITSLLQEKGVEDITINSFKKLLENCELARYAPITQVTIEQDYNIAAQTILKIDKQLK